MPGYRTATGVHYYEQDYTEVIKSLDPIAYWPMGERFGSTAYDATQNHFNGGITGATLGEPGIGDGLTSMFFDAVNDRIDIYSAALAAAFNGSEGTLMTWLKVNDVGIWTDSTARTAVVLARIAGDQVALQRNTTNNEFQWWYSAGGTFENYEDNLWGGNVGWLNSTVSWSKTADEAISYANGVAINTQNTLGNFVGPIAAGRCFIGAGDAFNFNPWHGWLAHAALFDRPLTPAEVQLAYRARWTL